MSDFNQNQLRGYKATVHNPRISDEAKDRAREVLQEAGVGEERGSLHGYDQNNETSNASSRSGRSSGNEFNTAHTNNVLGGYKAALSNPNVSDEAKEHSEEVLREHGAM